MRGLPWSTARDPLWASAGQRRPTGRIYSIVVTVQDLRRTNLLKRGAIPPVSDVYLTAVCPFHHFAGVHTCCRYPQDGIVRHYCFYYAGSNGLPVVSNFDMLAQGPLPIRLKVHSHTYISVDGCPFYMDMSGEAPSALRLHDDPDDHPAPHRRLEAAMISFRHETPMSQAG